MLHDNRKEELEMDSLHNPFTWINVTVNSGWLDYIIKINFEKSKYMVTGGTTKPLKSPRRNYKERRD